MDPHVFLGDDVADFFYTVGGNGRHIPVETLPAAVKEWVLSNQPTTTHVGMGPTCGLRSKMEWCIRGWTTEDGASSPSWEHLVHTQWRKL